MMDINSGEAIFTKQQYATISGRSMWPEGLVRTGVVSINEARQLVDIRCSFCKSMVCGVRSDCPNCGAPING